MIQLNKETIQLLATSKNIYLPSETVWNLPEKVLQFGTGVLLRGLPDYYINKANNKGLFNGRIVVVKSTAAGSIDEYEKQNNLYTHCIKGLADDKLQENYIINAAISRVINANDNWQEIIHCASNAQLQIIISNTTEVGIALQEDDNIHMSPPQSFPGKLLAFLHARYQVFNGSKESGMVIIPTELLVDNGTKLKDIVTKLAQLNHLDNSFINWLITANDWCNSLVDRIVPGALPKQDKQQLEESFGYSDELAIMSEPYSLWAIETKRNQTKEWLSFSQADKNVIITDDVQKYRELKLRLLNGTHTFCCGLAFLSGFDMVNAAMKDDAFQQFIYNLVYNEIIPCLTHNNISNEEAKVFAGNVISRFKNPFIQHKWSSIAAQYTSKIKQRCVPLLIQYYKISSASPQHMALGFAAYLLFMKAVFFEDNMYYGERFGERYLIQDEKAGYWFQLWKNNDAEEVVNKVLNDTNLWGESLAALPDFKSNILMYLQKFTDHIDIKELIVKT